MKSVRRLRSAETLTEESGPVEAAHAAFAGGEHGAGAFDATGAGFGTFGGSDPMNPVPASDRRDGGPGGPRLRRHREGPTQVSRDPGFRFLSGRRDFQRHDVACLCPRGFAELLVDLEPVA